jgi:hypothetical protein
MHAVAERSIRITVARGGLQAHLALADVHPDLLTQQAILNALKEEHIPVTDELTARIKQIADMKHADKLPSEPVLLVQGREPTEGAGASFTLNQQLLSHPVSDNDNESPADFHRSQIVIVDEGTCVGTLTPEVLPVPGVDVYGKPVPAPRPSKSIQLGANIVLGPDGTSVMATRAGKVHITRREISVLPMVDIKGDVDFSTGNVDAPGNIIIGGTIRDTFQVHSGGSITVRGAIEAAEVEAQTDLQVNGGIICHGQGCVKAGGEIFTRFCHEARIESGHDITITHEAMGCKIRALGQLLIARGKLIGGKVYARCGGEVQQMGNEANVKTEIAIGIDPMDLVKAAAACELIKKQQQTIAKIRQSVQPLMAQLKRLTPAQREKATELLYQADTMEQEVATAQKMRAEAMQRKTDPDGHEVCLVVQKIAYPGVSIIFGDKITTLQRERKGPFKLVCRVHNRTEEILAIDTSSGSITVLGSREYEPSAEDMPS